MYQSKATRFIKKSQQAFWTSGQDIPESCTASIVKKTSVLGKTEVPLLERLIFFFVGVLCEAGRLLQTVFFCRVNSEEVKVA